MPRGMINVKTNIEDGIKIANKLEGETVDAADDAAKKIGRSFIRESARVMAKNGSVVTGEGLRKLRIVNLGKGRKGVAGPAYLKSLDQGTVPHWPDTSHRRFIAAANSYGISKYALARSIAQKGTEPHPWIGQASSKVRKTAKNRAKIELDQAIQTSLNT